MNIKKKSPLKVEDLEEKLKFYERILEELPAIIFEYVLDENQHIWVNDPQLYKALEHHRGDEHSFFQEYIHPQDIATAYNAHRKYFFREDALQNNTIYRVKELGHGYRWIFTKINRLPTPNKTQKLLGLAIDMSNQLQEKDMFIKAMRQNLQLHYRLGLEKLSKREREILTYLSKGFTTQEIAEKLHRSAKTIEKHRANLLRKLDCRNAADLVRTAHLAGWIDKG